MEDKISKGDNCKMSKNETVCELLFGATKMAACAHKICAFCSETTNTEIFTTLILYVRFLIQSILIYIIYSI